MEYTKGEWYHLVDKEKRHHIMSRGKTGDMEQNVAVMSVRPEAEANAHLIAAAPDLYEACKQTMFVINAFNELLSRHAKDNEIVGVMDALLDNVIWEQALAKVKE